MFALLEPNVNVTVDLQRDEKQQIWKEEKKNPRCDFEFRKCHFSLKIVSIV